MEIYDTIFVCLENGPARSFLPADKSTITKAGILEGTNANTGREEIYGTTDGKFDRNQPECTVSVGLQRTKRYLPREMLFPVEKNPGVEFDYFTLVIQIIQVIRITKIK